MVNELLVCLERKGFALVADGLAVRAKGGCDFAGIVAFGYKRYSAGAITIGIYYTERACKPTDNAFIESFNARFRQECLNEH